MMLDHCWTACHHTLCHPIQFTGLSGSVWVSKPITDRVRCRTGGLSDTVPSTSTLNRALWNATSSDSNCCISCQETCTTPARRWCAVHYCVAVSNETIHLDDVVADQLHHSLRENCSSPRGCIPRIELKTLVPNLFVPFPLLRGSSTHFCLPKLCPNAISLQFQVSTKYLSFHTYMLGTLTRSHGAH